MPSFTPLQHEERYTIRAYEIDQNKRATVPALVRLMHESAMQNVIQLKLSVWDLEPHQVAWVLMRSRLEIRRLPILGEQISILTYPAGFERKFTYRDYRVFDDNGEQIAWSSSTWLLMDTKERKMASIPSFILEYGKMMPSPDNRLPVPDAKFPPFGQAVSSRRFTVNYFDLDFNQHLNNTLYMKWMLESLPDDMLNGGVVERLDLQYRAESRWKDRLVAETQKLDEQTFLHRLRLEENGKELALARSVWQD